MTLLYFCLSGLDLLNRLDDQVSQEEKRHIIDWIYAQQVIPQHFHLEKNDDEKNDTEKTQKVLWANGGFRGGTFLNLGHDHVHDFGHLAMSYVALATLVMLGDDLERVNREAITRGMRAMQHENGCFQPCGASGEMDIRFVFCACAISFFIDDWSGVDVDAAERYILDSRGYDFAFSHGSGLESHGGSTYCALSALLLMGRLHKLDHRTELTEWLLRRQISGFHGRPQKDADTCYSFWVGASLKMLNNSLRFSDASASFEFTNVCQSKRFGGIGKVPSAHPDILHSYMGLSGLALLEVFDDSVISRLYAPLGISMRAARRLNRPLPEMLEEEEL